MLPFSLFLNILANLLTIALLGFNYYFVYQWYQDGFPFEFYTTSVISGVLTLLNLTGWLVTPPILSKYKGEQIIKEKLRQNSELQKLFVEKYPTQNSNITLIFTHGWSTTAQIWYYFDKAFEKKYNLVFWDEPGLGKSKQPEDNDYSLSKYATDLKDIISSIPQDQKIVLVGHSIGGMIIQQLHKDNTSFFVESVDGIALFNTTYINPIKTALLGDLIINFQNILIKPALYIQAYTWPIWQLNNLFSYLNGSLHLASYLSGFRGNQSSNDLNFTTRLILTSRVDTIAKGTLGMLKLDTLNTLKNMQVPSLVVGGQNDILTKPSASRTIANNITNSTFHIIPNIGHMGILENSQSYIDYLDSFILSVSSPYKKLKG